jgi:hypothetical protein
MNCGAQLADEYCAACGQRHEPHLHSVGHFMGEAFESITHADSRLWRTLGYLIARPGRLTREFFDGRRVRYLPPFRLYLVISLLFFLIAGLTASEDEGDLNPRQGYAKVEGLKKAAAGLEKSAEYNPGGMEAARHMREAAAAEQARLDALKASGADAATMARESGENLQLGFCDNFEKPDADTSLASAPLRAFCKKATNTSSRDLSAAVERNLPRAMFVLLPLLALLMKLLYWRPKRFYVEHLLFMVHNHAFIFISFTALVLLGTTSINEEVVEVIEVLLILYILWYLFRAMRVTYGQSRWLTFGKYMTIALLYLATSLFVLGLTAAVSAMTA